MSFQAHLETLLKGPGVQAGGIFGADGSTWAAEGVAASAEEARALWAGLRQPALLQAGGIVLDGKKYVFVAAPAAGQAIGRIRKSTSTLLAVAAGDEAVVVVVTEPGAAPGNVTSHLHVAEALAKRDELGPEGTACSPSPAEAPVFVGDAALAPFIDSLFAGAGVERGDILAAGLFGEDGATRGARGFEVSAGEARALAAGLREHARFQSDGIVLAGVKYVYVASLSKTEVIGRGRKGAATVLLAATPKGTVAVVAKGGASVGNVAHRLPAAAASALEPASQAA